jgi:hypothetical protein
MIGAARRGSLPVAPVRDILENLQISDRFAEVTAFNLKVTVLHAAGDDRPLLRPALHHPRVIGRGGFVLAPSAR